MTALTQAPGQFFTQALQHAAGEGEVLGAPETGGEVARPHEGGRGAAGHGLAEALEWVLRLSLGQQLLPLLHPLPGHVVVRRDARDAPVVGVALVDVARIS